MNYRYFAALLIFALFSGIAFSEYTGNITLNSTINMTIVTGFFGYTVQYCNATADCIDTGNYKCFVDYDSLSSNNYQGWCNSTAIANCYNNGTAYNTSYVCMTSTARRSCSSSGVWGSTADSCAANYTCSAGTCSAPSTSTSSTSSSSSTTSNTTSNATVQISYIQITTYPQDFNITENETAEKTVTVKNNGNLTLYSVSLSLSGIDAAWFNISPASVNNITKNISKIFTINFKIPENITIKTYDITVTAKTNSTAEASASFKIKVMPSNKTIETKLKPQYTDFLAKINELENNISVLEAKGINITEMKNLLNSIKEKLNQTNKLISSSDFYAASQALSEAGNLIENLKSKIQNPPTQKPSTGFDFTIIIIVGVIAGIAVVVFYLFWPSEEEGFMPKKGWFKKKEEEKILKKLKKKKEDDKFEYKYKK